MLKDFWKHEVISILPVLSVSLCTSIPVLYASKFSATFHQNSSVENVLALKEYNSVFTVNFLASLLEFLLFLIIFVIVSILECF